MLNDYFVNVWKRDSKNIETAIGKWVNNLKSVGISDSRNKG